MKADPTSCAMGPKAVGTLNAPHLCTTASSRSSNSSSFSSATIYFPQTDGTSPSSSLLPTIVLIGGWGCGEQVLAAWGPFLASHGIVAMTIGTPRSWEEDPPARAQYVSQASLALQTEHTRPASPLYRRLDTDARGVMGYSLGGGGAQLAALSDPMLKCSVAICPHDGKEFGTAFPSELTAIVPSLIVCAEKDKEADSKTQAWEHYRRTRASNKMIFEIEGGDHYSAIGPAGGNQADFEAGAEPCMLCNCLLAHACLWGPCPNGNNNGSSGHAREEAPRGAVGGIVLAWLRLFLLGDESARSMLEHRPDIASGFESQMMDR